MPQSSRRSIPHLEQYSGLWAMEPRTMDGVLARLRDFDLAGHVESGERVSLIDPVRATDRDVEVLDDDRTGEPYEVLEGGVAVIHHVGTMTKYASSLARYPGTIKMREQIRRAVKDRKVGSILLRVDSPGGLVTGTGDLADEVFKARQAKPVYAYVEDLSASAAYWVTSQCTRVLGNPTCNVGSIGVFQVIDDASEAFSRRGVTVHVIKTGPYKGAGVLGAEITGEQLEEFQRVVDEHFALFVQGIARGRGMSTAAVRALADGRVFVGEDAAKRGLIDDIASDEDVLAELRGARREGRTTVAATTPRKELTMSAKNQTDATAADDPKPQKKASAPEPASLKELKAEFPDSTPEFREKCLEAEMTLTQATKAWANHLAAENAKLKETAKEAAAAAERVGVDPVKTATGKKGNSGDYTGDPIADFDAAIRERTKDGATRDAAIAAVVREQPELHVAYLKATNPGRVQRRLIDEKYDVAAA